MNLLQVLPYISLYMYMYDHLTMYDTRTAAKFNLPTSQIIACNYHISICNMNLINLMTESVNC